MKFVTKQNISLCNDITSKQFFFFETESKSVFRVWPFP